VQRLWGVENSLDKPTTVFDNCGLIDGSDVVIPSKVYPDALTFLKKYMPPLMSDFEI